MKLELTKEKLKYLQENFESIKNKYNNGPSENGYPEADTPFGHIWFYKPDNVLWLYYTENTEDYEGSQTQIGIKSDGTIVWGYFSHCSCYGYEDYNGEVQEFVGNPDSFKMYEMEGVESDVLKRLNDNFNKIFYERS